VTARLAGHGLRHEGRYWTGLRYVSGGMAPGVCECGAKSDDLPSANARKRWHRDHKADVQAETGERAAGKR
jgi:hypothetical protein